MDYYRNCVQRKEENDEPVDVVMISIATLLDDNVYGARGQMDEEIFQVFLRKWRAKNNIDQTLAYTFIIRYKSICTPDKYSGYCT